MKQHLSTYIVHYVTAIASICTVLAATKPAVLGPDGAAIVSAAAFGVAIAHALGISPAQIAKAAATAVLLGVVGLNLSSCSTLKGAGAAAVNAINNPASAPLVAAGVELAVGTQIQLIAKTPAAEAALASQYEQIATALEAIDTGNATTLGQLDQALIARLNASSLNPADKLAAQQLVGAITAAILQAVNAPTAPAGQAPLTPQQQVAIKSVLDDVILAASAFQVHAMAALRAELLVR